MPDSSCGFQSHRAAELLDVPFPKHECRGGGDVKKERSNSKKLESPSLVSQGRSHVYRDNVNPRVQTAPKKPRAKESSMFFGVRFRPDLHKWVAEIRVAEWKSVDKKVWLGTFDTEVGSAMAVDAARKLLKCKKQRRFNIPCSKLDHYSETIPSHFDLNDLENDTMFKQVTLFIKHKAQEYAATVCTNNTPTDFVTAQPLALDSPSFFSWPLVSSLKDNELQFFLHPQTSSVSSCEDRNSCHESSGSTLPCPPVYSSSLSSSTSKEESLDWYHSFGILSPFSSYESLMDENMVDCDETMNVAPELAWEGSNLLGLEGNGDEDLFLNDSLFDSNCPIQYPSSSDNRRHCSQELATVDTTSRHETCYNNDMPIQRATSSTVDITPYHPSNSIFPMSSLDPLQVH